MFTHIFSFLHCWFTFFNNFFTYLSNRNKITGLDSNKVKKNINITTKLIINNKLNTDDTRRHYVYK